MIFESLNTFSSAVRPHIYRMHIFHLHRKKKNLHLEVWWVGDGVNRFDAHARDKSLLFLIAY